MTSIECTKRLASTGGSLAIMLTKEASILGLHRGDKVRLLITPLKDEETEQTVDLEEKC